MAVAQAMTVRVLMEILSQHPQDRRVVVEGHDGGWDDPQIGFVRIVEDENKDMGITNMGRHAECVTPPEGGEACVAISAVPWTVEE